ncbi:conjugal transfer protein TrbA [Klebsiella sp. PL-2018]|uniref:secretion/conjugation apparatus DotM-related subunit n=1 Tax=Klebsiella sp. PL-2018 TaxID=2851540 RepID=UPI001C22532F|nr:conjugal transfer protein TrbA [Klebsiella sp. PL-2018]QXD01005.1 TrbA [Klebsiella sp. PL-2018]
MYSSPSYNNEDPTVLFVALLALLGVFILIAYLFLPELVYFSCVVLHSLWGLFDWGPLHAFVAPRYNLLAETGNHAQAVTFSQWREVMGQTVYILHVFLVPLTLWALRDWFSHPAQSRFTRRLVNIRSLPAIMAPLSPALAPVIREGHPGTLYHKKKLKARAPALTPEAFVTQHALVSNMQLDVARARECFTAQLGRPLKGWKSLAPHERALFAIFGLQHFLNDRPAAVGLMNALNDSCRVRSRRDHGSRSVPVYSLASTAFARVIRSEGARQWLKQHRYVRSGLVCLYAHDLRLTPPNWLWLKSNDRTLFYALHRANTTKVFIEGAGVVAVARAEAEAIRRGLPCPEPCVEQAINGLQADLVSIGLIWDEPQPDHDRKRRVQTRWSITGDVFPRAPQNPDNHTF